MSDIIIDIRKYTLKPGQLLNYLDYYSKFGYVIQRNILGSCVGWYIVDNGMQNTVIQLWKFKSFSDYEERKANLLKNIEWTNFKIKIKGIFFNQESSLIKPLNLISLKSKKNNPKIVDFRSYTLNHGMLNHFLMIYKKYGIRLQSKYWNDNLGYFTTFTGTQNQIIHLWGFNSYEEKDNKRNQLMRSEEWKNYLEKVFPLFKVMENITMRPAFFWKRNHGSKS